ncbi:MAG TPA: glycolate oxidase subunit GlcF [Candidatus Paenalcaligenes intestinipullorum]|uniref:Glycolate oxidase iron-sulfur subunit n=1 Tax=Candidatus Paenalcaligenes intestinipullorum TaxID=2838718 RepID=A0A9D2RK07_9BURK|nr:glycolate oxidase subunit GlcF [Candidatus Paenalcaligenes intestinipullorum]
MYTELAPEFIGTLEGETAKAVIAKCVHCGFCNATCPTYQILGDELDGPRGRIYLMKEMFEGKPVSPITREHLDRCLTCRNCETTCPSGVQYSKLVDVGRRVIERKAPRPATERFQRLVLKELVSRPAVFKAATSVGYSVRGLLPESLKELLPKRPEHSRPLPTRSHSRKVWLLDGCVQPSLTPQTNQAAIRVLDALGIGAEYAAKAGCCGAVTHHLNDLEGAQQQARNNIDAWWPGIADGSVMAIISTASGCGVQLEHYAELLAQDPAYADKAVKISELAVDISVVIQNELAERSAESLPTLSSEVKVAIQEPCTFQHGLKRKGQLGVLLSKFGYTPVPVKDGHLCCGSAGTYSVLQPELSHQLRRNKLADLQVSHPDVIATANVGCHGHLAAKSPIPVRHWIELVDDAFAGTEAAA